MERRWETRAAKLVCAAAVTTAVVLGVKYLWGVLLPFALAWVLSLAIDPVARRLGARTGVPRGVWAVLLLLIAIGGLIAACCAGAARAVRELQELLAALIGRGTAADGAGTDLLDRLASVLAPQWREALYEWGHDLAERALSEVVGALSAALPSLAASLLGALPSAALFVLVTVISGFYFCLEPGLVGRSITACLPSKLASRLPSWRARVRAVSFRYLRAYLLLLCVTFSALLVGFLILRVRYALLLSLAVAVVDLLPVLGVGTVLIPWAVVLLLRRQFYQGFGLLILYAAVTVLRQVVEPRLIGKSLGLHPLAALVAGYAGWRWFGVLGMALGPIAATALKALWRGMEDAKKGASRGGSLGG